MIENIWPTPIYYDFINNLEEVQQEIQQVVSSINYKNLHYNWGKTHQYSNHSLEDFIGNFNLHKTKKTIIEHLKIYCQEIGFEYNNNFSMTSWMNSFRKDDYAKTHHHGGFDISGVYYFKTNGNDGDLIFENYGHSSMSKCFHKKYSDVWVHKPVVGKILLFPPWVLHCVGRNINDTERNSIVFNISFK